MKRERLNLNSSRISNRHTKRIPFVTQFHPFSYCAFNIIKKHWGLFRENDPTIDEFSNPPLPSYRKCRTLRDCLVRSDQYFPPTPKTNFLRPRNMGSFPCLSCIQCNSMIKGKSISHPHKGFDIPIKLFLSIIICDLCHKMPMWVTLYWRNNSKGQRPYS